MKTFCLVIFLCAAQYDQVLSYQIPTATVTSRRELLFRAVATAAAASVIPTTMLVDPHRSNAAITPTGPLDGNLVDLPPEAVRSYLQYRIPLQTSADFYVFELRDQLADVNQWGEINELFQSRPSRMEREFTNVFRILGLSMPPDVSDVMSDAQSKFERAAFRISKITSGVRRDLPVEIEKDAVPNALESWEEGRQAINEFFVALNEATGLTEMKTIPPYSARQLEEYGRSKKRYVELKKKVKLCQNRGGPTLSQAWGQLMVSGYLQDSCGIPDLESYFYQS
jgi:hypothetical protein